MHVHRSFYDTGNSVTSYNTVFLFRNHTVQLTLTLQGSTCSLLVEVMLHGSQDQGRILDFLDLVQVQFLIFFKQIPHPLHGVPIIWRIRWNDHQALTV